MISILLTGHGEFATGLAHSLQMIAGTQTYFKAVPFSQHHSAEELENAISNALTELLHNSEGAVIFTDILGGTPFKSAMLVAKQHSNVEVVCGTNLPMLIETVMSAELEQSALNVALQAINIGKETIMHMPLSTSSKQFDVDESGI